MYGEHDRKLKINKQFQTYLKEYILTREELAEKLGITEEIDHVWLDANIIGIATKWKVVD